MLSTGQRLRKDVWSFCTLCQTCPINKPRISKLSGHLQSTPVVEPRLLLGLDYCSKWVELFPLRSAKTHLIVNILIKEKYTRWGTPTNQVSDRGQQFMAQLVNNVCKRWEVIQKLTKGNHPQTNITERTNGTLKTMISSYVKDNHRQWDRWLSDFRYAINTALQESTGLTPAEIALGRN